ncbi:hypothetical protein F5Y16DRAFT_421766 [Xylariaceae sp. FL0255]|nr:hypothetical protein F5Y16DRAFT_421766 [Xylariaceae sp. FL0255]
MNASIIQSTTIEEDGIIVKAHRQASARTSQFCAESAYLELKVPEEINEITRVVFTTVSHDQGWASNPGAGSYTWWETLVTSPSSTSSGSYLSRLTFSSLPNVGARRMVHQNVVANRTSQRLQTIWDGNTPDDNRNVAA